MKIAFLSRGPGFNARQFVEKLIKRGYKVYFISYYPPEDRIIIPGAENFHYDYTAMHRFGHFRMLQTAWHLRKLLKIIKPDILHTGWIQDHGFIGALTGFHPVLSMPWGSDILINPDLSRSFKRITKFTLNRADMITCDCELVKNRIIEISGCSPEKIVVFPWGIDLQTFHPKKESRIRDKLGWQNNKILIMTRQFAKPIYGHRYFIEALPAVVQAKPETRVIFVASGPLEASCRSRVAELGLQDHVYFGGRVKQSDMALYLNAADVYVTTSLSDGTSVSLLEAMACGLPVVVSDAPVYFEWVDDGVNGYIVPRRNSGLLSQRLVSLLNDDDLRHKMGQHNVEIARETADWEKNLDILGGIYESLLRRNS